MKKKLVLTAAVIAALSVVSCNGKKTNSDDHDFRVQRYEDSRKHVITQTTEKMNNFPENSSWNILQENSS